MIDLQPFCSHLDTRREISAPWKDGEKAIATNGHIIVIADINAVEPFTETPGQKPDWRDAVHKFTPHDIIGWLPLADWHRHMPGCGPQPCTECNGVGTITLDRCEECDGTGKFLPHEACEFCGGTGKLPPVTQSCMECDGTGKTEPVKEIIFPQGLYNGHYLNLMLTLPGIEFAVTERARFSESIALAFRFAGGHGIVMPVRGRKGVPPQHQAAVDAVKKETAP